MDPEEENEVFGAHVERTYAAKLYDEPLPNRTEQLKEMGLPALDELRHLPGIDLSKHVLALVLDVCTSAPRPATRASSS